MAFPSSFPSSACEVLIASLTPGGKPHTVRDQVEAGYDMLGYVLSQMLPGLPMVFTVSGDGTQPETKVELLRQIQAHAMSTSATGVAIVAAFPWMLAFELIKQLVEEFLVKK